ncbi:hypothetical protein [Leifsonia sp. fls2-241-R2A-40a]|uniref:hypothetical protein n=1 Tax=Leifsonia sp. fls2-241-R2A-40a TaxID=3040290 RepID=UPI00254EAE35|nr:hypothetical protein [Leifsonia sp. fls2-241-R2A-40a]
MSGRSGVILYVAAAVPGRSADAGAVVAAVLAGTATGGPAVGGLLAGALTIPHLVGPLAGRLLDARRRPGPVLAGAFAWYAVFAVAAAALLPVSTIAAALALAAAGCAGPLVTGGLSSRLAPLLDASSRRGTRAGDGSATGSTAGSDAAGPRQRRGQALDALTYGVAGTVGPAAIAVAASVLTPRGALAATAGLLLLAAIPVLWLPGTSPVRTRAAKASVLRLLVVSPPLRRTTVATIGSATALAAAPVIAASLAAQRGASPSTAAVLMSLYGAGGLVASLVLLARPLTGRPERLVARGVAAAALALLLPLLALPFPAAGAAVGGIAFAAVGAVSSVLFAATLAARTEYSPPGAAARIFATVAGIKVAGSAIGVAAAGLIAPFGAAALTLCAAVVCALTLVAVRMDALACARRDRAYRRGMPTYTANRPLEGDADEYFDYVSDPENLPAYFPRVTEAHELPDGKVETTAHVDADQDGKDETVTSEANFDVDRAAREVRWSAPGPHDYHGALRLTDDGVELTIHTTQEFDGMQQALDGSLAKIAENLRAKA